MSFLSMKDEPRLLWGGTFLKKFFVVFLIFAVSMAWSQEVSGNKTIELIGMISGQLSSRGLSFAGVDYYFDDNNTIYIGCGVLDKIGNDSSHISQSTPYLNVGFKPVIFKLFIINVSYRSYLDFLDKESIFFCYDDGEIIPYVGSLEIGLGIRL